jgi:hypothetical protein
MRMRGGERLHPTYLGDPRLLRDLRDLLWSSLGRPKEALPGC